MQEIPLRQIFRLIEPGPVVLVTTAEAGRANVMTMSWHMVVEFDPPLIGCILGPWDYSFEALSRTGECVVAIPTVELIDKVIEAGNLSGRDVPDKFAAVGLTPVSAAQVSAPLVRECFANLECVVEDTTLVERYGLFILRVVKGWIDPALKGRTFHAGGDGTFVVDGETINLQEKMIKWREMV